MDNKIPSKDQIERAARALHYAAEEHRRINRFSLDEETWNDQDKSYQEALFIYAEATLKASGLCEQLGRLELKKADEAKVRASLWRDMHAMIGEVNGENTEDDIKHALKYAAQDLKDMSQIMSDNMRLEKQLEKAKEGLRDLAATDQDGIIDMNEIAKQILEGLEKSDE